jgi:hypothetical protein
VWLDDHPELPLIGNAWPGELKVSDVYARHFFTTTNGVINMHSGIPDHFPADPGAALNGIQLRRMVVEPPLFVQPGRLRWLPSLDATHYDVVRGDLSTLLATGGDFTAAVDPCLANDTPAYELNDADLPAPGEGDWFLVRGVGAGGPFTWNSAGAGQVGDRDAELSSAAGACQ